MAYVKTVSKIWASGKNNLTTRGKYQWDEEYLLSFRNISEIHLQFSGPVNNSQHDRNFSQSWTFQINDVGNNYIIKLIEF